MIDLTYGHLADDADDHDRGLLDACDRNGRLGHVVGTLRADSSLADRVGNEKTPLLQGLSRSAPERIRTYDLRSLGDESATQVARLGLRCTLGARYGMCRAMNSPKRGTVKST